VPNGDQKLTLRLVVVGFIDWLGVWRDNPPSLSNKEHESGNDQSEEQKIESLIEAEGPPRMKPGAHAPGSLPAANLKEKSNRKRSKARKEVADRSQHEQQERDGPFGVIGNDRENEKSEQQNRLDNHDGFQQWRHTPNENKLSYRHRDRARLQLKLFYSSKM
jgi:hypothetical protein